MKLKNILIPGGMTLVAVLAMSACTNLLKEKPRATYTPDYFSTPVGIENGIANLYWDLRNLYGDYFLSLGQVATDEMTFGDLGRDGNWKDPDFTVDESGNVNASNDPAGRAWNNGTFSTINNASGIIENGMAAGIAPSLLAEANFFRAYRYFLLVTVHGGAPLDLGAGELKFNTAPSTSSKRNTVPEVYTRAIFPDLKYCIDNLPETSRMTGTVTKNVARLFLARAYLTYAWWLDNPNNIPTWPEAPRTDPDGKTAEQYFQLAYDLSLEAINNPGPYGLMPTFFELHLAANDRNREMMFYVDHYQNTQYGGFDAGNNATRTNYVSFMTTWQYDQIRVGDAANVGKIPNNFEPVARDAIQEGGRPWARMAPTIGALKNTFADKTNDSRYDGTFVTTYFGNWEKNAATRDLESVVVANGMSVPKGGAILKFLPDDLAPGVVSYPAKDVEGISNVHAGIMPGESAFVVEPGMVSRRLYPHLWKVGPARTDHNQATERGGFNGSSPRPQYLAKFSEFYFIAAEAAVKGASGSMSARDLINVIRARAGKWIHKNSESIYNVTGANYTADFSAEMVAATPATIDIDYILAERSREYYGEGYRWFDLTRTQKWAEYGGTYEIVETRGDAPETWTRNIANYHYLRPIPTGQFDNMMMPDPEENAYQNPGWPAPHE
jgi:hypothetical protein